ncbi:MAG: hypothetical protein LW629_05410, partial [Burkholderiales bacterium]|nr:hypothetical protein [Burkholderiales bacterium]
MTSPTIAGTQFFSTTSNTDGWLKKASIVTARVTFSEAVFVTGKPLLNLMVGSTPVQAKYFSGSSTANRSSSELLFTFTVGANMFDADGLSLASTSLSLPTGTAIKNSLAEMAELSVLNPQPVAGLKVDSTLAVVGINGADATRFGTTIKKGAAQSLDFSVSEAGTAYLLSSKVPFTGFANATAAQKKSLSIAGAQASNALSLDGLAPGIYKLYFVDAAGNLTTLTKTVTVDNVAPKLLAAPSISGTTGLEKSTLGTGDVVTFAARFSEEVVVSGVPTLAFKVGSQTLYANFSNTTTVSGKSTVFFTHTVDFALRDANGISIDTNAIALNGGSISDYAGNTATLTHALVKDNAGYKVDSAANQLVSIGIDGWTPGTEVLKGSGQTITFKAVFGEQVSVLGTPKLNVNVGGTVLQATAVASTAASTEVKFVLTLPLNVSDSDGISLGANPIEMTSTNNIYSPVSGNFSVVTFAGAQFETYKVNAMAASISEVGFSNSRTDSPSVLKLGDVVTATVKFSQAVVVSNKSALMLKIGELDAKAAYLSGSNSDTIKFTYTIAEGMQSTGGIKLADAPLLGMAGTSAVKDMAGFNANLGFNFAAVPAYMPVDAKSVVINAINISSADALNGYVGIGAQITAVVNFSEAVEVTGNPTLNLKLDAATPVVATYSGGNNTNALTFIYTVGAGDTALAGVGTPSAPLALNGAVLKDAAGNLLKTAFAPVVSTTKVDTTGPVPTQVSYSGDTGGNIKTLKAGDVIAFELTYPEAVTVTGVPSIGVQIGSNLRQALCTGQNVSKTVLKFSYTVQAGDTDVDGIALGAGVLALNSGSITDAYGNPASLSHPAASFVAPLKVDTTAPDAPVLSIAEGAQNGLTYSEVVAGTPVYQVSATGATKLEVTLTNAQGVSVTVLHTSNLAAQSYQLTRQDMQTLGAGQINVSATALDAAGNRSQVATGSFNMDLAQVAITQVALAGGKASGFYKAGDIVIASLTFSETVVLKSTPQNKPTVALMVGATEVQASYAGGSNSSTLRFAYTVGADHADDDGIGLLQNSLQLNGSTLASLSGVTPVFAHASIVNNPEFKIDTVAPNLLTVQLAQDTGSSDVDLVTNKRAVTVGGQETDGTWQYSTNAGTTWSEGMGTSFLLAVKSHAADAIRVRQTDRAGNVGEATVLAGPVVIDTSGGNITTIVLSGATGAQNAFLNAGDVLTAMVSFSELVDVTGQPKLALVVGSTAVQANYANGSGTPAIYFTYTVAADMTDADGIHVPLNALSLNGATLKDRAGNVMQITSALGSADTNYRVDTTKPAVLVLNVDVTGQFSESQAFTLNSQAGISGLESNATWQFSTNAGVSWSAGSGQTFVIPDGSYAAGAILIRQLDAAGNASDATAFPRALVVDTEVVAPTLTLSTDAGGLGTDGVSNLGSVAVGALEAGAAWQYSTNSGASWTTGTGSSFTLAAGTYAADAIQVKQTDLVGNVSVAGKYVSAIVIDQTAATISSLSITSATGVQNSRLNAGDVVTVAVVFSELVDVTGAPTLGITVGASAVNATYASGSGSNTLNFVYTIQAGQTDADGINVSANAITLNGGSINDRAGNATTITNTVGSANGSYMVDTTAPSAPTLQITDTGSSPSDGITNNATVTVNGLEAGSTWQYSTSELVDVTGAPTLGITVGASAVNATYASGSGSNTLNFVYTIQAGQTDADGINVTANAITLNGGSINDRAGNATSLGSTIGSANASYMVDTTVPAHSGLTTASTTENVSTLTTVYTAQASDAASSVTYSLSGADAAKFSINTTSGAVNFISSPNFEAPTDTGANNIYDINVVATDLAGNAAARAVAITVTDILNAGEYTSPAGESVIDLGSYGKLIAPVQVEGNWYYYWDLSGDGSNTNTGLLNSGSDRTTHDFLDGIFRYASDFKTLDTDNDTDNIYRYAVLNGIRLALPTVGHSSGGVKVGTYVGTPSEANNEYDDLIAIWDAHNGIEPISSYTPPLNLYINGTPSGWTSSIYLAATRGGVANYHGNVRLNTGAIDFYADVSADQSGYVALQVLSSTPPLVLANDTGRSSTDNISTNGLVNVPDLITGNAWQYTIDSGTSWLNGTGISFTLAAGNYAANAVQVRQTTPEGVTTVTARNSISFVVDATVPTVSSVAITAATGSLDSILNVGDVVTAVVVFSELVDVTGAPTLGITVGASAVNATYASG